MNEPILYVDRCSIGAKNLEEVKVLQKELADFIEANEPQLISYGVYISAERTHMAVTAVHPDSASMLLHMEIGGPIFRKFQGLITLETIDVYGSPSAEVVEKLREKASMLGDPGTVTVHALQAGFARLGSP